MVYTVTFNPSLDYIISLQGFQMGSTNRTREEQMLPGGKGINVSTVLQNLGIENTALGFTAGFTGQEIERMVSEIGFQCDFIRTRTGFSRINVKLKDLFLFLFLAFWSISSFWEMPKPLCKSIGPHFLRLYLKIIHTSAGTVDYVCQVLKV